ncbi:MAG: hypothetical protein NTW86_04265 [Candidatus Sumerlaeota bacterium]|nr:hypothetical protein [Candidatus Sumerlaeota bacterium]
MSRIAVLILLSLGMFSLPVSAADSEAQGKAQDAFDSLYGADVKRVRATKDTADDAALAAQLLEAARTVEAQPEFLAILCTNACELAAADPKGYETAQAACDLAMEKAPAAAGACQDAIVTIRRRQYDAARGDAKAQACDALIDALAAAADTCLRGGNTEGAYVRLLKAATVARQARSQKADMIEALLKTVAARQRSAAEAERVKKQLEADPANAKVRDQLVRLLVVDLDSPAEAAKYLDGSSDATLRKFVPAAAKPVADAPELACPEMMDWYVTLAATAGLAGKAAMNARAVQYGERFLKLHTAQDLDRTRAELAVKKAREAAPNPSPKAAPKVRLNLLAMVVPSKHVVSGAWKADARGFTSDSGACSRVMLPYQVPEEYDYRVDLTRNSGQSTVCLILTKDGRDFVLEITGPSGMTGFAYIDGKHIDTNPTGVKFPLVNGRRYSFLVQVRNTGLKAFVDGQQIIAWKTDYKNLTPHSGWALPDKGCVGFGSHINPTTFHAAEIVEVSGRGKRLP